MMKAKAISTTRYATQFALLFIVEEVVLVLIAPVTVGSILAAEAPLHTRFALALLVSEVAVVACYACIFVITFEAPCHAPLADLSFSQEVTIRAIQADCLVLAMKASG